MTTPRPSAAPRPYRIQEVTLARALADHRPALEAHCMRLLGSREDAEDALQETFLRAWRSRGTFEGRSSLRSWLFRIATNVCFDLSKRRSTRLGSRPGDGDGSEVDQAPAASPEPDAELVAKETAQLALMAAIRHLPRRQRGALVLHGVLGWSAHDTGSMLDTSAASVSSALQRARRTLSGRLPERRLDWTLGTTPSKRERALLGRYLRAIERADVDAFVALLEEEDNRAEPGSSAR